VAPLAALGPWSDPVPVHAAVRIAMPIEAARTIASLIRLPLNSNLT
jgi:hypothetical protein